MLELPALEMEERIKQELEENPALEEGRDPTESDDEPATDPDDEMTAEDSSSCGFSAACPMPVLRRRAVLSAAMAALRRVMFIRVISFSFVMAQ